MRLDDDRIAGGQAGEHRRIGVPRREGGAADHQPHAARDQHIGLLQGDLFTGERAAPGRRRSHIAHRLGGIGEGLDAPVQRIGAGAAERLGIALAGDMHDRVGHLEISVVETRRDLQAQGDAQFEIGLAPGAHGADGRNDQGLRIALRIADAERLLSKGRDLLADLADDAGLAQVEGRAQTRLERRLARARLVGAVDLRGRTVAVGAPALARLDRVDGGRQRRRMARDQRYATVVQTGRGPVHQPSRSTIIAEPTPWAPCATTMP